MAATLRLWTVNEKNKLIDLVEANYAFLTEGVTPSKTKAMINRKWEQIVDEINSLGEGSPGFTLKQVKKKWADIKSATKKVVQTYKQSLNQTGNQPNKVPKPNSEQEKIGAIIGTVRRPPVWSIILQRLSKVPKALSTRHLVFR